MAARDVHKVRDMYTVRDMYQRVTCIDHIVGGVVWGGYDK